jgi:hypothetical protein
MKSATCLAFWSSVAAVFLLPLPDADGATLYLAFGVDVRESLGAITPNPLKHLIRVRDLHGDHYHSFSINNGTPGGHVPVPLVLVAGSGTASFGIGAVNISPFPSSAYLIPGSPAGDFRLELVALRTPGPAALQVEFEVGGQAYAMVPG